MKSAEQGHRPFAPLALGVLGHSKFDIGARRQVRKERQILEDIADAAAADRQINGALGIKEHLLANPDAPGVGAQDAGD